jgi:hypothetical protein
MNITDVVSILAESVAPTKGMSEKVASVWKTPVKIDEEKTTDDQLDSYFADLLQ